MELFMATLLHCNGFHLNWGAVQPPRPLPTLPPLPAGPCKHFSRHVLDSDWIDIEKLKVTGRDLELEVVVYKFTGDLTFPDDNLGRGAFCIKLDDHPAMYADFTEFHSRAYNFIFQGLNSGEHRLVLGLISREGSHTYDVRCFSVE